jgi:hypothetical protein
MITECGTTKPTTGHNVVDYYCNFFYNCYMNWLIEGLIFIAIAILVMFIVVKVCDCFGENK